MWLVHYRVEWSYQQEQRRKLYSRGGSYQAYIQSDVKGVRIIMADYGLDNYIYYRMIATAGLSGNNYYESIQARSHYFRTWQ